jgi:hypothetical protein
MRAVTLEQAHTEVLLELAGEGRQPDRDVYAANLDRERAGTRSIGGLGERGDVAAA